MQDQEKLEIEVRINSEFRKRNISLTARLEKEKDLTRTQAEEIQNLKTELEERERKFQNLKAEYDKFREEKIAENHLLKSQNILSRFSVMDRSDIHLFTTSRKYTLLKAELQNKEASSTHEFEYMYMLKKVDQQACGSAICFFIQFKGL